MCALLLRALVEVSNESTFSPVTRLSIRNNSFLGTCDQMSAPVLLVFLKL